MGNFVVIMMFSMNVVNTKVVDNSLILDVLKFHDFRTIGLRVIDHQKLCSLTFWTAYKKYYNYLVDIKR